MERYQTLGASFYRGADACMMVFDVTNSKSFENLKNWKDDFLLQVFSETKVV